jgi:hypothetical protein
MEIAKGMGIVEITVSLRDLTPKAIANLNEFLGEYSLSVDDFNWDDQMCSTSIDHNTLLEMKEEKYPYDGYETPEDYKYATGKEWEE